MTHIVSSAVSNHC